MIWWAEEGREVVIVLAWAEEGGGVLVWAVDELNSILNKALFKSFFSPLKRNSHKCTLSTHKKSCNGKVVEGAQTQLRTLSTTERPSCETCQEKKTELYLKIIVTTHE